MRIIAGRFRGMRLEAPAGEITRPMTDQVRETVFNILGARLAAPGMLPETEVLDLFAGSGALGIESLSRGARSCIFVERDRRSLQVLRGNLSSLKLTGSYRVVSENIWTLRLPRASGDGFGLIFVDPPFRDVSDGTRVADLLERAVGRLSPEGVAVFRYDVKTEFAEDSVLGASVLDRRTFGRNRFLLLGRADGAWAAGGQQEEEEGGAEDVREDPDG